MLIYYGKAKPQYILTGVLGSGGEGDVYNIQYYPDLVAKIYNDSKFQNTSRKEVENKILSMLDIKIETRTENYLSLAWPVDILYNEKREFVGFVMPRVDNKFHLFEVTRQGKNGRDKVFDNYSYDYSILIAYNLAHVVDVLHQYGIIVGDFNPNNILVDKTGHITLIDTDSFTIRNRKTGVTYKCNVGVPEYLAPELQGVNLSNSYKGFTKETDNFALAIHIFTLMAQNCHPFGCKLKDTRQSSISESPKVYNITRGNCPYVTGSSLEPPAYAPDLSFIPAGIQGLIDKTFTYNIRTAIKSETVNKRATPTEWKTQLYAFYNQLMQQKYLVDTIHETKPQNTQTQDSYVSTPVKKPSQFLQFILALFVLAGTMYVGGYILSRLLINYILPLSFIRTYIFANMDIGAAELLTKIVCYLAVISAYFRMLSETTDQMIETDGVFLTYVAGAIVTLAYTIWYILVIAFYGVLLMYGWNFLKTVLTHFEIYL